MRSSTTTLTHVSVICGPNISNYFLSEDVVAAGVEAAGLESDLVSVFVSVFVSDLDSVFDFESEPASDLDSDFDSEEDDDESALVPPELGEPLPPFA